MKIISIVGLFTCMILFNTARAEDHHIGHHEHTAPHGGTLVVFGDEFAHLEFVLDSKEGKLTTYVLDGEAKDPIRINQKEIELIISVENPDSSAKKLNFPLKLRAVANPLTGESEGDTSQFDGESDFLKGITKFDGVIALITIKGIEFKDSVFNFPRGNEEK